MQLNYSLPIFLRLDDFGRLTTSRRDIGSGALGHLYLNRESEHTEWSVFAYLRYLNVRYETVEEGRSRTLLDRDNYTLSQYALGLGGSYKWVISEHLVLSLGGGMGRVFGRNIEREVGNTGDFLSLGIQSRADVDVYARVTLGYRFRYANY